MDHNALKIVINCQNIKINFYLEAPGGKIFNQYLKVNIQKNYREIVKSRFKMPGSMLAWVWG